MYIHFFFLVRFAKLSVRNDATVLPFYSPFWESPALACLNKLISCSLPLDIDIYGNNLESWSLFHPSNGKISRGCHFAPFRLQLPNTSFNRHWRLFFFSQAYKNKASVWLCLMQSSFMFHVKIHLFELYYVQEYLNGFCFAFLDLLQCILTLI